MYLCLVVWLCQFSQISQTCTRNCNSNHNLGISREPLKSQAHQGTSSEPAASIWFEIWGSWIRVKKSIFPGKFPKNFDSSRQISEKFSTFPGKFSNKFRFSRQMFEKFRFFHAKIYIRPFLVIYSEISIYPDKFAIY